MSLESPSEQPPSSANLSPRENEFAALLGIVTHNFRLAQQEDRKSGGYKHLLIDREVTTQAPLARFGMVLELEEFIRRSGDGKGPSGLIEVIVPVDEFDAHDSTPMLSLAGREAYFMIRNPNLKPEQIFQVTYDNYDELFASIYDPVPTSDKPADDASQSYLAILSFGETVPLRKS